MLLPSARMPFHLYSAYIGARARGYLIEISDGMFGCYVLVGQSLASMKMPLLNVPSGGQGHRSRSNECILKKNEMFLFSDFIKQMLDTVILVTNNWRIWLTVIPFIKEINGILDTKMTVTPLLFDFQKISWNYGARERGRLIQISDGMFGWYILVVLHVL